MGRSDLAPDWVAQLKYAVALRPSVGTVGRFGRSLALPLL